MIQSFQPQIWDHENVFKNEKYGMISYISVRHIFFSIKNENFSNFSSANPSSIVRCLTNLYAKFWSYKFIIYFLLLPVTAAGFQERLTNNDKNKISREHRSQTTADEWEFRKFLIRSEHEQAFDGLFTTQPFFDTK